MPTGPGQKTENPQMPPWPPSPQSNQAASPQTLTLVNSHLHCSCYGVHVRDSFFLQEKGKMQQFLGSLLPFLTFFNTIPIWEYGILHHKAPPVTDLVHRVITT